MKIKLLTLFSLIFANGLFSQIETVEDAVRESAILRDELLFDKLGSIDRKLTALTISERPLVFEVQRGLFNIEQAIKSIDWTSSNDTEEPDESEQPTEPTVVYQRGNFLEYPDGMREENPQTLMSINHGDDVRDWIIDRCASHIIDGQINVMPFIYGYSWNNWSGQDRNDGAWQGEPWKKVHYDPANFNHWFHWFDQIYKHGMEPTVCIFANDALNYYNDPDKFSDDDLFELAKQFIEFTQTQYDGHSLVRYIVLKMETEDEWSIVRANRMYARIKPLLADDQKLGYHPQLMKDTVGFNWENADFIAIQTGFGQTKEETANRMREAIEMVPEDVEIICGEFAEDGWKDPTAKYLLDVLPKEYPNRKIIGSWNG